MASDLRTYLARRLGDRCLSGRRSCTFELRRGRGNEAVFDPYNRRIKLYGIGPDEFARYGDMLAGTGADPGICSKVTVYALPGADPEWASRGFRNEGIIRGFFAGHVDAVLWALYIDPERGETPKKEEQDRIVRLAEGKVPAKATLPPGYASREAARGDAPEIARLLGNTFEDYPTPVDEATIERLVRTGSSRFRIVRGPDGKVAAVAAAEIDALRKSAEMTDCATADAHRGKGLMAYLLKELGREMADSLCITDIYSLCRADEPGINLVLGKLGYAYTGRLSNNCRMPNGWESMNIWCKTVKTGEVAV